MSELTVGKLLQINAVHRFRRLRSNQRGNYRLWAYTLGRIYLFFDRLNKPPICTRNKPTDVFITIFLAYFHDNILPNVLHAWRSYIQLEHTHLAMLCLEDPIGS